MEMMEGESNNFIAGIYNNETMHRPGVHTGGPPGVENILQHNFLHDLLCMKTSFLPLQLPYLLLTA